MLYESETPRSKWNGVFRLSKNPYGVFRQTFAVCCAHIVDTPDTGVVFASENYTGVQVSPLPIKRVPALWGPHICGKQSMHLQPEKYFVPGTRPGTKWIWTFFAAAAANSARLF